MTRRGRVPVTERAWFQWTFILLGVVLASGCAFMLFNWVRYT